MSIRVALFLLACLSFFSASSQDKYVVSGYVRDASSGEEMIAATVYAKEAQIGLNTNVYGFYSITLPAGTNTIDYSFIGYDKITKTLELTADITINVELSTSSQELEVAEVTAEKENDMVNKTEMSVDRIDSKTIKQLPALLGEPDVIRSLSVFPGVSTVGEVSSGFNARGGNIDQNLILQDEAPVYNSSHLFGFFSVFNPDAVKNVELTKGGIDPRYGGRLSSVLDVRLKDGNSKRISGTGGVGVIFSRLMLEGPIVKDKASWLIAGRRSYADILARPFLNDGLSGSKFSFYDLTAKLNWRLNDKNRLFLSGYFGRDQLGIGSNLLFDWGNATATLRWNHIFDSKLFMNVSAVYSDYDYAFGVGEEGQDAFSWKSRILNYSIKPEFSWFLNENNTIRFGGQSIYYDFVPAEANFASAGQTNDISLENEYGLESAVFAQNEQKVSDRISMKYGVRFSLYQFLGQGTAFIFDEGAPGQRRDTLSSEVFGREVISNYPFLEPRLAIKYQLNETSSLKASYMRTSQFLHLISNTAASLPTDVWIPSTNNIKPQVADQVAVGWFKSLFNETYELSIETYYKDMQNQVDYIDNATIFFNPLLEGDLLQGDGRAYGLELLFRKNKGDFTGIASYTLSRTERLVNGINNDEWFPTRFDKPHNLNLSASYQWTKRFSVSANFALASGTPSTFPTNRIEINNWVLPHNIENNRNNFRVPTFHRLDLSAKLLNKQKEGKRWSSYWQFSIYNAYGRRNPFAIFFRPTEADPLVAEAIRYSIIGSVVPAVSYNFEF